MATTTRLTLREFLRLPETKPAIEYDCGEVIQKPMPDAAHSVLQIFLGALMLQAVAGLHVGRVATELRCVFGPRGEQRSYVPDIVFVSRERLPAGKLVALRFLHGAPDVAVEILSRGQPNRRFNRKIEFYLAHGVRLVWIINPRTQTISVLAPGREPLTLAVGDTLDGGAVLPGFSVAIADIFAQLEEQ
ncbi:MAG: Uma2 family endonuclease [Dehalococcoidia bacterium]